MKIIEGHAHIYRRDDIDFSVKSFQGMLDYFKFEAVHICSYIHDTEEEDTDITRNVKALYCKKYLPAYVSGAFVHHFGNETPEFLLDQAKRYMTMGCDGIKMLEGKPGQRKKLGVPLDSKLFGKFYEYAEKNQIPVVLHSADPPHYWDYSKLSDYEREKGWFCDSSYPSKDDFRKEVWGIMEKFPKLPLVLAHMGFLHDNKEYMTEFVQRWDNTMIDLTPNNYEMLDMGEDILWWKDFFVKWRKRIMFGTDAYSFELEGKTYEECFPRTVLLKDFLETDSRELEILPGRKIERGLGLFEDVLKDIYYNNFIDVYGKAKPLCPELIAQECKNLLENPPHKMLSEDEMNLKKILKDFSK